MDGPALGHLSVALRLHADSETFVREWRRLIAGWDGTWAMVHAVLSAAIRAAVSLDRAASAVGGLGQEAPAVRETRTTQAEAIRRC